MGKEQGSFLLLWAESYRLMDGSTLRVSEPTELDTPLPDTMHRCTLMVPMTVIRLAAGTEFIDGQFVEYQEDEPIVCTYDETNQTISIEVRVESQFYDADDLHFQYYQKGFDNFVRQSTDLRLFGELEDQLGIDPSNLAYERLRNLTHIASGNFRSDGKKSLSFGFTATIAELEEVYEALPKNSQLFSNLDPDASDQEKWDFFVKTTMTAAVDSIRIIYPTLYRYMYYWFDEGEDRAAYEHLARGQTIMGDHSNVFDEAMQITHGKMVENSPFYQRLARERLATSQYWIGQWTLDRITDGTIQSARLADPVFEERDDPGLLICRARVPIYIYDHDAVSGDTNVTEDINLYWDERHGEIWIEMHQLGNFGIGAVDDAQLQMLNERINTQPDRFQFYRSSLQYKNNEHHYIAYGRVVRASDAQDLGISFEELVTRELNDMKNNWKHLLDNLKSYRIKDLGREY